MNKKKLWETDKKYVWHPFTQMLEYERIEPEPLVIERGEGSYLYDIEGNRYIDGISSLWVTIHGHNNKHINRAIIGQVNKISHTTLLGLTNEPAVKLAKILADITPAGLKHVFYSDNGSTAVEIALKVAFQYWQQAGSPEKTRFVSFAGAYHGDTIGSVSVGGIDLFHKKYEPLLFKTYTAPNGYCYRCELGLDKKNCELACFNKLKDIVEKNREKIAAVIIEPLVQGAAGMVTWPNGFLSKLRRLCTKNDVLLIVDEVATGFGRTGKMFACEHENVSPDLMAVAKGITGGYLPLAATLATDKIYKAFLGEHGEQKTFYHGHTYTGNPVACSAALASIGLFDKENVLEKLQKKIEKLTAGLQRFTDLRHVGEIRQRGFMVGIELVRDKTAKEPFDPMNRTGYKVILQARKHGVILRPLGDVIVLMPPLSISDIELEQLLEATYSSIKKVTEGKVTSSF